MTKLLAAAAEPRAIRATILALVLYLASAPLPAQDAAQLLRQTERIRQMSEADVIAMVPVQSGLQYVDCPNCTAGHQERQLVWDPEHPDEVICQYCKERYPSAKYPMKDAVVVKTPLGNTARFEYWADASGYKHFFKARRDFEVKNYMASQALALARLYQVTKDPAHGRRAAIILDRFAQVFPDWCYHYDYPFQQKQIYDGDVSPADFRNGFRTARWNWWAYSDIPSELMETYSLLQGSDVMAALSKERGVDVAHRVEADLLRQAGEQVIANRDDLTNMSPGMWSSVARLGRVIHEPRYVHEVVRRCRQLVSSQFFYDGMWCEGAPSYGQQTVGALQGFLREVRGYSDPPGVVDPVDKSRFDNLNLENDFPQLVRARYALDRLRLPTGRPVPVHDTWASDRSRRPPPPAASYLLPALGHGCLNAGKDERRAEWHLTWSGGYGHQHSDILSLLLFAENREVLSDLGYSHTAYRAWTLATAAHNAVVIDGRGQAPGSRREPTDGTLLAFDDRSPAVQFVHADGRRAYPEAAKTYKRAMFVIDDGASHYAVDIFDVEGGKTHDYFLHGDADAPGSVTATLALADRATLLPEGVKWKAPTDEGQTGMANQPWLPYGFLQKLKSAAVPEGTPLAVDFEAAGKPTVRATVLPPSNSELTTGENPSIRGAREDDAKLENFHRPFMMLRRQADGAATRFVSIIEPIVGKPAVSKVRRLETGGDALAIEVQAASGTHLVVFGADREASIRGSSITAKPIQFRGEAGVLLAREGVVQSAWSIGQGGWKIGDWKNTSPGRQTGNLLAIENDSLVVDAGDAKPPAAGDVIRLVMADGWAYPFNVVSADGENDGRRVRIKVVEGLEMDFDAGKKTFQLRSFPQRAHEGDVYVDWMPGQFDSPGLKVGGP